MDHSATVFLLDRHAREVAVFTPPFDAKQIAQDLRTAAPDLKMSRAKTTLFDRLAKSAGPLRAGGDFLQSNKNG
jgi:hypothetical protein